jgi:hypothetical protein
MFAIQPSFVSREREGRMREWVEWNSEASLCGGEEGTLRENAEEGRLEKDEPGEDGGDGSTDDWGDDGWDT